MLFLASKSPRRRELLEQLDFGFSVLEVDVAERCLPGEPPSDYVSRVARAKAGAGLLRVMTLPDSVVIGADTEVVLDREVFGKPDDAGSAIGMLERLSGRTHEVISVVWCVSASREACAKSVSKVTFAPVDAASIAEYVATGEPFGKAGGYAIQGRAAAFVRRLEGSYSGVVGLPLFETAGLIHRMS
ncbi:MAG: Maf family protein [Rhodanobacteraceae bacterium]